jgi:hypothetical protein
VRCKGPNRTQRPSPLRFTDQRVSCTCSIGKRSTRPVLTMTPGIMNGFFEFSFASCAMTPARVGFRPAFLSASTKVCAAAIEYTWKTSFAFPRGRYFFMIWR